jgi:hypothetical protein
VKPHIAAGRGARSSRTRAKGQLLFVYVPERDAGGVILLTNVLEETIAEGAKGCRVIVYLKPSDAAGRAAGREYVRS